MTIQSLEAICDFIEHFERISGSKNQFVYVLEGMGREEFEKANVGYIF